MTSSAKHTAITLDENERKVYEVILNATKSKGGIFQVKLKELTELKNLEPQQIARIVSRLVRKGLVKRKLVNNNGKSMYFLQAVAIEQPKVEISLGLNVCIPISVNTVINIPCFRCKELFNCSETSSCNPFKCPLLTNFLLNFVESKTKNSQFQ